MLKVSVITSVYDGELFLARAIESILAQSLKDFEFIIVNDCSADKTSQILKKFSAEDKRIKLINNQKRLGLTKSLNKALKVVRGKYIARMDADDICHKERLKKQTSFLEKNPDVSFCGSSVYLIDEKGRRLGLKTPPLYFQAIRKTALLENPFIHPTLIFRREVLVKEGGFNEDYRYAQDYELVLRLINKHKGVNLANPLLFYRVGTAGSISFTNLKKQEWFALKARWLAFKKYGYQTVEVWKLIKPVVSFLVPDFIKIPIYRKFFWNNR